MTQGRSPLNAGTLIAWVTAGAIGFYLARIIADSSRFQLDDKVDPVAIAALLLSVILSVIFFRTLERQKYSDQLRKDALLERLRQVTRSLRAVEDVCRPGKAPWISVVSAVTTCRRDFETFVRFARELSFEAAEPVKLELRKQMMQLRNLLTNTPRGQTAHAALSVVANVVTYSEERRAEIDYNIREADRLLGTIEILLIRDIT